MGCAAACRPNELCSEDSRSQGYAWKRLPLASSFQTITRGNSRIVGYSYPIPVTSGLPVNRQESGRAVVSSVIACLRRVSGLATLGENYAERASPKSPYMLATGEKAISHLDLLERIFGPATRLLLSAAGLCSGMHVAEIGCGIGLTARWVSTQVSPGGSVAGVDSSSEQLQIGERSAAEAGRHKSFIPRRQCLRNWFAAGFL